MTRPAAPEALRTMVAEIVDWLNEDVESYGHLHGAAYEGRKGGNRRAAAICKTCEGRGWMLDGAGEWRRCEQCTPAQPDPTGDVVVNMAPVRAQLAEFTERVARVWQTAKGNGKVLRTAEKVIDRGADTETVGAALRRAERRSADEIAAARDAKQRRLARGEQLPGDGAVTPAGRFERVGLVAVDKDGRVAVGGVSLKHARYVLSEKDGEILLTPAAADGKGSVA